MIKILFNIDSFGGNAKSKLRRLLQKLQPEKIYIVPLVAQELNLQIQKLYLQNEPINLAGGDGTFHCSLNFILKQWPDFFKNRRLGLVGVGSSNSLLKSLSTSTDRSSLIYLNNTSTLDIDVGEIQFTGQQHYFLANGSVGLLALGNDLFNRPSKVVAWAKKVSTELANFLVFLQLLKYYKPQNLIIQTKDRKWEGKFLNLQFLKAKFYTGGYYLPSENTMDSGFFDLHLFFYQSRWQTLKTFFLLSMNKVQNLPNHEYIQVQSLEISSDDLISLEIDGELYQSHKFNINCHRKKIKLAGPGI